MGHDELVRESIKHTHTHTNSLIYSNLFRRVLSSERDSGWDLKHLKLFKGKILL